MRHLRHLRLPDQWDGVKPRVIAANDVDNPLLGEVGAARTYGPQKGAGPDEVELLELGLGQWADIAAETTGHDLRAFAGTGAAGGAGFGLAALLGAEIHRGIDVILDWIGFDDLLSPGALVIVGEGSLDAQTLNGKGPLGVARRARANGCEVVGVAGRNTLTATECAAAGLTSVHALLDIEPDISRSITNAAPLLQVIGERLGPTI